MPNGSGLVQYFQEIKRDQLSTIIAKNGLIDDAFIILCARYGTPLWKAATIYKEYIQAIDVEWETFFDATFKTAQGTTVHLRTRFRRYQDYYNRRLEALYDSGNKKAPASIYRVFSSH